MADEPYVDTHIHFWDKSVDGLQWAWLEPGYQFRKWTFDSIVDAPRYRPQEFRAEADGQFSLFDSGLYPIVVIVFGTPLASTSPMPPIQSPAPNRYTFGVPIGKFPGGFVSARRNP